MPSGPAAGAHRGGILILTARTGAGHDLTAQALALSLRGARPDLQVRVHAPFAGGLIGRLVGVDRWYDALVAHAPCLWGAFYHGTNGERAMGWGVRVAHLLWGRQLRRVVGAYRPTLVVSVHPLCARLATIALPRGPRARAHHCVVTDLVTVHCSWAAPDITAYYVATQAAADSLRRSGVAAPIHVTGLPLRPAFAAPPVAAPGHAVPSVLLLGGGHASRRLAHAARALLAAPTPPHVTIVCGGNRRLQRRLSRALRGRATVRGWCDDVAALMRAADVIVTKAGSVTLAEAFSQGRPVVTYQALPGQEEGNIGLLNDEGYGVHAPRLSLLRAAVARATAAHGAPPCEAHARRALWWGSAAERVAALIADAMVTRCP